MLTAYKLYTDYADWGYYGTKELVIDAIQKETDHFQQHFENDRVLEAYLCLYDMNKINIDDLLEIFDDNSIYVDKIQIEM